MKVELSDSELSILRLALLIDIESDSQQDQEKVLLLEKINSLIKKINRYEKDTN